MIDIEKILDNHDATPLKQRFYPREIYHTAEWSQEFLTPTEKLKSNIFSSKYSEIFNSSKLITEHEHSFYPDIQNPLSPEKAPFNFFESQSSKGPISNKQKKAIRESFERKQLINKGYCFVTFASTDQAKIVLLRLNRARESFLLEEPLNATLKEDLEHYELDNEFIFKLLKRMKSRYTEYLNEIKQKGEQCSFQWERDIENSNQYLESQMQKNDVRKTLEDVLEKELFNDGESATIAGLKPSENYDKISIGRQNSLVVTEKDLKRLRELIDGNIDKKIDEWKVKSKTSEALMAEYINPLHFNENQLQNEMETLRLSIEQQAKELYFTQFSKEEQKEVSLYIKRKVEYFSLKNTDPQNQHNIDSLEALKMFNINPDKYYELIEDKAKKWQYLEKEPFNLVFSQEGQSSDRFENSGKTLLGKVEKKQRFIRFVKYLQMLLLGKFDAKSSTIFDQQGFF